MGEFEVFVSKEDFKFNCSHFIAFEGFRERLHGHNYRVSIKVIGTNAIGADGYLIDFGDIKSIGRSICKSMNEYFIVPMKSDVMTIGEDSANTNNLCMECKDGSFFSLPKNDCILLPIVHSSAEEISHYIWCQIVRKLGIETFLLRGIRLLEVGVAEAPSQTALFRHDIPTSEEEFAEVEHCKFRVASGCLDC